LKTSSGLTLEVKVDIAFSLVKSKVQVGITFNIKNAKFVKDLPMIDAQFRFNQCNSFREEYISVFSPYGLVLIL
jgi:hypothetical protein